MSKILVAALLVMVTLTALAIVRQRNLFASTILLGIYSLLMALIWQVMQALDVAFTEAAVGAGISTVLLLGALIHCRDAERGSKEKPGRGLHIPTFLGVLATGVLLLYGEQDMPRLGKRDNPVHQRASAYYVSQASKDHTGSPNLVTAVLASYRGFDTLFETAVIFTAGASLTLLLRKPEQSSEAAA